VPCDEAIGASVAHWCFCDARTQAGLAQLLGAECWSEWRVLDTAPDIPDRLRRDVGPAGDLSYAVNAGLAAAAETHKIDAGGPEVVKLYDTLGRERIRKALYRSDGRWVDIATDYDGAGRVQALSEPYFDGDAPKLQTMTQYDNLGHITLMTIFDGSTTQHQYQGNTTLTLDPTGHQHRDIVDARGRTTQVSDVVTTPDPHDVPVTFSYGPFDAITAATDAAGHVSEIRYDRIGRRVAANDPDAGAISFQYDAFDQLVSRTAGGEWNSGAPLGGDVTIYRHDASERVYEIDSKDGTTFYEWDTAPNGVGKLASELSPDGVKTAFAYDNLSRLVGRTWTIGDEIFSFSQSYDSHGRRDVMTYPSTAGVPAFGVQSGYSSGGQLVGISDLSGKVLWTLEDSDPSEQFSVEVLGNGLRITFTPTDQGLLGSIAVTGQSGTVQQLTWACRQLVCPVGRCRPRSMHSRDGGW
jgi:YD repeat-containing protein